VNLPIRIFIAPPPRTGKRFWRQGRHLSCWFWANLNVTALRATDP
jgi:hypothetical protein